VSVPDNGQPFAADGGITHVPAAINRDPFEALDDLMTVIEALCPGAALQSQGFGGLAAQVERFRQSLRVPALTHYGTAM
jgi:hypothetical protein